MQFGTEETQHLLSLWFKCQQCLACCMLLLWEGQMKCAVEDGHKYEPTDQQSHKEIHTEEWWAFASGPILD